MLSIGAAERSLGRALLPPWWLFLITGIGWMLLALILLRFDYATVSAISILFGVVAIAAGVLEIGVMLLAAGWWKLLHGVLASSSLPGSSRSFTPVTPSRRWPLCSASS
jgi:uncharacterized membrane protein HdeD (DUF308 family)